MATVAGADRAPEIGAAPSWAVPAWTGSLVAGRTGMMVVMAVAAVEAGTMVVIAAAAEAGTSRGTLTFDA